MRGEEAYLTDYATLVSTWLSDIRKQSGPLSRFYQNKGYIETVIDTGLQYKGFSSLSSWNTYTFPPAGLRNILRNARLRISVIQCVVGRIDPRWGTRALLYRWGIRLLLGDIENPINVSVYFTAILMFATWVAHTFEPPSSSRHLVPDHGQYRLYSVSSLQVIFYYQHCWKDRAVLKWIVRSLTSDINDIPEPSILYVDLGIMVPCFKQIIRFSNAHWTSA